MNIHNAVEIVKKKLNNWDIADNRQILSVLATASETATKTIYEPVRIRVPVQFITAAGISRVSS